MDKRIIGNNCRSSIAGQGATIAISLAGHRVTVLEAASGIGEVIVFPFSLMVLLLFHS